VSGCAFVLVQVAPACQEHKKNDFDRNERKLRRTCHSSRLMAGIACSTLIHAAAGRLLRGFCADLALRSGDQASRCVV
jgi:hypothetical protein